MVRPKNFGYGYPWLVLKFWEFSYLGINRGGGGGVNFLKFFLIHIFFNFNHYSDMELFGKE